MTTMKMKVMKQHRLTRAAAAPLAIRAEHPRDGLARETLLDLCFGANRHARTCHRLREGQRPAPGLAFTATRQGRLVGTLRLWPAEIGGVSVLLLGPLAVDPSCRSAGLGAALMRHALTEAARRGHRAIVLLGDAPYYARFGFTAEAAAQLSLPGPFERERLLALELVPGALQGASGLIRAAMPASAPARAA